MFLLRPHDSDEESAVYNSVTDIEGSNDNLDYRATVETAVSDDEEDVLSHPRKK